MGWLIGTILCTLVILGFIHYSNRKPIKEWHNDEEYVIGVIMGFIMSGVILAVLTVPFIAKEGRWQDGEPIPENCYESVQSWDIISAVRDETVSSSFILGTGGTSRVDRYYVYRVDPKGLKLVNYNAHRTYVVEQDSQPRYEISSVICPKPIHDLIWFGDGRERTNTSGEGILYVPPGTILREFRM